MRSRCSATWEKDLRRCYYASSNEKGIHQLTDPPAIEVALATEATLRTKRLLLEPLQAEHAPLLHESLRDERLYRFMPQEPPDSLRALERRYSMLSSRRSPDGREAWLNFALRLRQPAWSAPTYVGTLQATVLPDRVAYIAYTMFVPFQRKGYAMEGCVRLVEHLIGDYLVRVVVAEIDTRNVASIALSEALGFERVSTTIGADHFKGSISDEFRYELRVCE